MKVENKSYLKLSELLANLTEEEGNKGVIYEPKTAKCRAFREYFLKKAENDRILFIGEV